MKQSNSKSSTPADNASTPADNGQQQDWKEVLFEVLIKILTLGFYHIKKHKG